GATACSTTTPATTRRPIKTATTATSISTATAARTSRPAPRCTATRSRLAWFRTAHRHEADERRGGEGRDHGEHGRVGGALRHEGEHERCDRLHHQIRSRDPPHEMAVAGGAKQSERHGAARDGEQAVGHAEHHRENGGGGNREPEQ